MKRARIDVRVTLAALGIADVLWLSQAVLQFLDVEAQSGRDEEEGSSDGVGEFGKFLYYAHSSDSESLSRFCSSRRWQR
jgi:hypothetical protein